MYDGKSYKWDKLIVFLAAFIPRMILIICFAGIFRTPMDEMSTLSTGAYFGGKDWTALTTYARFYYGGGFSILFAPLYRALDSVTVYYIILSVCAALQSISAPISYTVLQRFLKIENRKYLIVTSLACSYLVATRAMMVFNEHIIIGCVWVCVYLLCKLTEDGKYKAGYTVALMALLSYMLTTHTRTKVIWIAFVMVVLCYRILYKKWLVSVIPAIVSGVAGYFLAGRFNNFVKTVIWDWQEGEFLRNANVRINLRLSDLKDPVSWQGISSIISGQLNTVLIFTGGIAAIFLTLLIYFYCDTIKAWFQERFVSKASGEDALPEDEAKTVIKTISPYLIVISLVFLLCTGAMIAAQSVTWLSKVMGVLQTSTFASKAYNYKALTYIRYMGPFLGPVFLCGAALVYHKKEKLRSYLLPSTAAVLILQFIWAGFVLPHIYRNRATSEVCTAFGGYDIVNSTALMGLKVYLPASIVLVIIFTICIVCYYRRRILLPMALALCLFVYEYAYGAIFWDGSYVGRYGSRADAGVQLIRQIEEDENYSGDLPEEIYVFDGVSGVQKRFYTYQVQLDNYTILVDRPQDESRHIVFSRTRRDEELLERGYKVGKMDKNEFVYVNDPVYQEMFEAQGIIFRKPKLK